MYRARTPIWAPAKPALRAGGEAHINDYQWQSAHARDLLFISIADVCDIDAGRRKRCGNAADDDASCWPATMPPMACVARMKFVAWRDKRVALHHQNMPVRY